MSIGRVDLAQVQSNDYKKVVSVVNQWCVTTAQFLNRFCTICERKLQTVHESVQRLEITMNILEGKLESIQGLEGITSSTAAPAPYIPSSATASALPAAGSAPPPPPSGGGAPPPPPPPASDTVVIIDPDSDDDEAAPPLPLANSVIIVMDDEE